MPGIHGHNEDFEEVRVRLEALLTREAIRHGDRVGKDKRVPKCFGLAKDRHRLGVAKMRVNIHETYFASEERRRLRAPEHNLRAAAIRALGSVL